MLSSYWDINTLILYLFMGIISELCIFNVYKRKMKQSGMSAVKKRKNIPEEYILLFLIWEIFACCRLVAPNIGGADSNGYARYFEQCLETGSSSGYLGYEAHAEILYKLLCKGIRLLTDDYHVFFFVCYGIIIVSYILIVEEIFPRIASSVPFVLLAFVYIRGFVTLRSILSASILLIAIAKLYKKRNKTAVILAIASVFFHKATIFYALFILFYFLYIKKKISRKAVVIWIATACVASIFAQRLLPYMDLPFLSTGSYVYFSQQSLKLSFWGGGWKMVASQLLLAVAVWMFNKNIDKIAKTDETVKENNQIAFVKLVCYYDFMMIPVSYILGVWRGYEYFYIFRLIMWGIIIDIIKKKINKRNRIFMSILFFLGFVSWFIFRLYNTWEDSRIMPYIFEPLYNIMH